MVKRGPAKTYHLKEWSSDRQKKYRVLLAGWAPRSPTLTRASTNPALRRGCAMVYVHAGVPDTATIQRQWETFAKAPLPTL